MILDLGVFFCFFQIFFLSFGGPWGGVFICLKKKLSFWGLGGLFLFFPKKIFFKFFGALGGSWGSFSVFFKKIFFFNVLEGPGEALGVFFG